MRITIKVRPSSPRTWVGPDPTAATGLLVRVNAPPVDGRATEAALRAVADALGVRRRDVSLVTGATSRTKVVEVDGDDEVLRAAVVRLVADSDT